MSLKKKSGWKCKGFTLIETVVSLWLGVVIYFFISSAVVNLIKEDKIIYTNSIKKSLISSNLETIEVYLRKNQNISFQGKEDRLTVKKRVGEEVCIDEIYRDKNKLVLEYLRREGNTKTVLLEEVDEFKVIKKEKLIYILLKLGGDSYFICI